MKALLPLAALVVGIGIGWMLKGSPEEPAALATKSAGRGQGATSGESPGSAEGPADHTPGPASGKSHQRPPKEAPFKTLKYKTLDQAAENLKETFLASIQEQQEKRNEKQIAKLVEKLGLDAAQEAKLREFFKKKDAETSVKVGEDGNSLRMHHKPNGDSLDAFLKDLLPDHQETAYEQMKQAELAQKTEAKALRDMASLTLAMELRPEQRDAVYAALEEQARNETGQGGTMPMLEGNLLPPVDLFGSPGSESVIAFQTAEGGKAPSEQSVAEARQRKDAELEAKVNRMSGILDERQLADYRSYLQQQPAFLLGR